MTNAGTARLGAALAVVWLLVLAVADLFVPSNIAPDPLFALAPLAAAAVMSVRATAGFAAAAVALVVLSGLYNQTWGEAQQWVRLVDVVLVGAAAVVIAEVRVRREQRFERVSRIAEIAQRAVLPTLPRTAAHVRVTARYQSAAEDAVVGGDLYDCSLVGGRVRFLVGDVRGKGIAAVEQAARVIRAFRQAAAAQESLPSIAHDMDEYLVPFMGGEDFATALIVDMTRQGLVTFVACGHPPPLLVRPDGSAELLDVTPGLPLGLGAGGAPVTVPWGPGDRLLLYTDGLSEARDETGRFLPLLDLAPTLTRSEPDEALDGVLDVVRGHVHGELGDDLAVVLLENTDRMSARVRPTQVRRNLLARGPLDPSGPGRDGGQRPDRPRRRRWSLCEGCVIALACGDRTFLAQDPRQAYGVRRDAESVVAVRPRDIAGKTRRRIAAGELAELIAVAAKIKKCTAELKAIVLARGSRLMGLHGVGPVLAARVLAAVGDVTGFADRNRFASWTGTAPLDASSGEQNRHPLSRAGNRRMNHMIHIAAISQLRLDTDGRVYYRRKRAEGKKPLEVIRCLKRRISDAIYRQLLEEAQEAVDADRDAGPGGHCRASQESSAADLPLLIDTSDQPLPGPANQTLRPPPSARKTRREARLSPTG